MTVRRHILFSGQVQGVGFRYSAVHLARPLGVTGWVRNLWDGRVEMEAQGESAAIDRLIAGLRAQRWIVIDDMEVREIDVAEEESRFVARSY